MTRRSVILVSALALAGAPLGGALAQIAPAGSQIYREAPSGPRGLPPSWLVDDESQGVPQPAPAMQSAPIQAAPLGPAANAAPSAAQDALRPPGVIGGPAPAATAAIPQQPGAQVGAPAPGAPQPGAPVVTASLPPDDQPEVGEP
jgi:hypothetical protein